MTSSCSTCQENQYGCVPMRILLICLVYESIIVFSLLLVATILSIVLSVSLMDVVVFDESLATWIDKFSILWLLFFVGLYFVSNWYRHGQTIAMKTWRILLVDQEHRKISVKRLILRYLISVICGSIIWSFFDKDALSLHDRLVKTKLIRVPYL